MRMLRGFGSQGLGTITFTIETKRANLPAALEILRQILREPTLAGSELEVMKNEEIAGAEQGRSDPMRLGLNRIQRLLTKYPPDDVRYVPTIDEQVERLKKVSLDQVRALYHDYLGAEHGEVVVVGDCEPSEILPILAKTLEGWKSEKPYALIERPYQPDIEPKHDTVSTPDKENAIYLAGLLMPMKDDDPDYPAMVMGNFVLGGGALSSRIADRLRQKGGLSYTAMSMLQASPLERRANFMVLAIYNPDNVVKVVTGVDEELARLLKDGVKIDELKKAKTGYLQQQQVTRTMDAMLAASLAENLFVGRTMQFQADLEQKIQALTPEAVDAALRKHLDPKRLSVVTAGDFVKKK
jgi:zinc protease